MSVEFKTDGFRSGLDELYAGILNNAHQVLVVAVKAAHESAATTNLFTDGPDARLRQSIVLAFDGPLSGKVTAGTKYAQYVEEGTGPHEIRAKRGNTLRFQIQGYTFFRKVVHHPGTKPRPFMARAEEVGEQALDYGLDYFTDQAIAHFDEG